MTGTIYLPRQPIHCWTALMTRNQSQLFFIDWPRFYLWLTFNKTCLFFQSQLFRYKRMTKFWLTLHWSHTLEFAVVHLESSLQDWLQQRAVTDTSTQLTRFSASLSLTPSEEQGRVIWWFRMWTLLGQVCSGQGHFGVQRHATQESLSFALLPSYL